MTTEGVTEVNVGKVSTPTPVIEPPKVTELPLMLIELFSRSAFDTAPVAIPPDVIFVLAIYIIPIFS